MSRAPVVVGVVLLAVMGGGAGEVSPAYRMKAECAVSGVVVTPCVYDARWAAQVPLGLPQEAPGARTPFRIAFGEAGAKAVVNGGVSFAETNGGVRIAYDFTPEGTVTARMLSVTLDLGAAEQGETFAYDANAVGLDALAERQGEVVNAWARRFVVAKGDGVQKFAVTLDRPQPFTLLHAAKAFTVRLNLAYNALVSNTTVRCALTVADGAAPTRLGKAGVSVAEDEGWVRVEPFRDIVAGTALDFSALRGDWAPAGKHGRVVRRGGQFEFEGLPGVKQRFYGVNICGSANIPDRETARAFARRLARVGYNALRIHHHDGVLVDKDDMTTLDEEAMCKFDGLVAACIDEGLYLTTDLFVSRGSIPRRACGIDEDGTVSVWEMKALSHFHEGVYSNFCAFARNFLTHRNVYTGRTLAEEPALGWVSFVNEGCFDGNLTALRKFPCVAAKWRAWLARKKAADAAFAAIPDTLPENFGWSLAEPSARAWALFISDVEAAFGDRVTRFLRDELKCRALTTNMNGVFYPAAYQVSRARNYDFVDDHFYVDHPSFPEKAWNTPSESGNGNPLRGAAMGGEQLAFRRNFGQPFTISEYNFAAPGRFRHLGGVLTGAAGALQDWSGLWRFAWAHHLDRLREPEKHGISYFDVSGDPLSLAGERASVCLFLRGDLPPLTKTYALGLPPSKALSLENRYMGAPHQWLSWYAQVGCNVSEADMPGATWNVPFPKPYVEDEAAVRARLGATPMGDGRLAIDRARGTLVLKTERTAGGFAEEGRLDCGALTMDVAGAPAMVWASALDDKPLATSSRVLLTHLTDVQMKGTRFGDRRQTVLMNWGRLPCMMRKGTARVTLAVAPGNWTVFALASDGMRRARVPHEVKDGRLELTLDTARDPACATSAYELVRGSP